MPIIKNKRTGIEEIVSVKELRQLKSNIALKKLFVFPETEPVEAPPEAKKAKAKKEAKKAATKANDSETSGFE